VNAAALMPGDHKCSSRFSDDDEEEEFALAEEVLG
jgi:hypothetical protein